VYDKQAKVNAMQRSADRRQREDDAPRLLAFIPELTAMQISIIEQNATGSTKHRRHVVVQRAPALFVITCGDERCDDEGHDITNALMHALRSRERHAAGEHVCEGSTGSAPCGRRIQYEMFAEYGARRG
jgi:hypothetical protein